jgi:hypothetical protein
MFTFNSNIRSGPFSDPKSEQIKQIVRQVQALQKSTALVSDTWFKSVKPLLAGLAHPGIIGANSASVLGVNFVVTDKVTNDNEYEVE